VQIDTITIDCVLFCVGRGILLLETKDYLGDEIVEVKKNNLIKFINRPVDYTGFPKMLSNTNVFIKKLDSVRDNIIIASACNYPFISEDEFEKKGMGKVIPRNLVFLKDDWKNKDSFESRMSRLFRFVGEENVLTNGDCLTREKVEELCSYINLQYGEAIRNYKCHEIQEYKIDLHANSSKELFYGICSFLMKNGITSGYICSTSKEVLDGLGEYMTAVKIPWSYEMDGCDNVGYKLLDGMPDESNITSSSVIISLNGESSIQVSQGRKKKYNIEIHNQNKIYENINSLDIGQPIHLKNEQIREMFLKAFVIAEEEIDIISPWMNFGVVNDYFVGLMRAALRRGVVIKIIYGLTPDSSEYNISRSNRSDQVANFLLNEFSDYKDHLSIVRDNIHYKLVLCDEKFKLEGGYNYLSFVGDYDNKNTRKEGSPFGTHVDEIKYLRKEYFG